MTIETISAALAPTGVPHGFHVSTPIVVIVVVVAALAVFAILGWRAPDRSPGADTEAERERIED